MHCAVATTQEVDVPVEDDAEEEAEDNSDDEDAEEGVEDEDSDKSDEEKEKKTRKVTRGEWEVLNDNKALWLRTPSEVRDTQAELHTQLETQTVTCTIMACRTLRNRVYLSQCLSSCHRQQGQTLGIMAINHIL